MNAALFVYHVLFLNTPPSGVLITLGCILIAFAYSLGGLFRARWAGMFLSTVAIILAINATWWIHVSLASQITEWTPIFLYDYTWSAMQIFFTSMLVALWMGIFGNLTLLSTAEA